MLSTELGQLLPEDPTFIIIHLERESSCWKLSKPVERNKDPKKNMKGRIIKDSVRASCLLPSSHVFRSRSHPRKGHLWLVLMFPYWKTSLVAVGEARESRHNLGRLRELNTSMTNIYLINIKTATSIHFFKTHLRIHWNAPLDDKHSDGFKGKIVDTVGTAQKWSYAVYYME